VTKEGLIAGPACWNTWSTRAVFEGERGHQFRILRAVKNRFGPTDEIGVFDMTDRGLEEVLNPSELFLAERRGDGPAPRCSRHGGNAPVLVEIQAWSARRRWATARRAVVGGIPPGWPWCWPCLRRAAASPSAATTSISISRAASESANRGRSGGGCRPGQRAFRRCRAAGNRHLRRDRAGGEVRASDRPIFALRKPRSSALLAPSCPAAGRARGSAGAGCNHRNRPPDGPVPLFGAGHPNQRAGWDGDGPIEYSRYRRHRRGRISALIAFLRGFVREMLTVGSWLGAALVTLYGFPYCAQVRAMDSQQQAGRPRAAGFNLFIVSLIVFSLISHQIAKFVRGSALTRSTVAGLLFGLARGAILVCWPI